MFLHCAVAGAVAPGLGSTLAGLSLAGCAGGPAAPGRALGRVVVIGGGFGGATAAKYLRMWSGGRIEVILVERDSAFVSCPMSNLVLGGTRSMADLTRDYRGLRAHGVQVRHDEVTAIDPGKRMLRLRSGGDELSYDRLIMSPGVDFMVEEIEGLSVAAPDLVLHAWKAGVQTVALRRRLESMPNGGVYVLSIPRAPYRCPPGPYERASQVAFYFKREKPRSKVIVLDANEDVVSKGALFKAAWSELYGSILEYRPGTEVKRVTPASSSVHTDFDSIRGDVLNVLPPMRAGDICRTTGLANANSRWCGVDWMTMESTVHPGIHVLGDATQAASAMPKSGHMANQHAKIAAAAIVEIMSGRQPSVDVVIANTCYSFVSDREAMHVASVHRYDNAQKTLVPVAGAGGLSAQRSEIEGVYAQAWAHNIWNDMFA
ncbi:FCSD flavin-binding domain-containing protein [Azohydromonas australica]|uniref:FCSD flavin-binding domain-containing protein n=1 Tax=Azohydromonas australica TaxID=364039 RepID=UPI000686929C